MANPNQRSERRRLGLWRRLRDWFRNLSNPTKVASVAGGVATTLAIITGLITVGEKINSAVGAGGDAKTEVNIPPMPQYDRSEVQKAIENQQEAVQEYAYPYTPPEQLEVPGEDAEGERISFYAPQYTSGTAVLEGSPPSDEKVYPFFTLAPGGREVLLLSVTMLPEYFYYFRVGVQYSYKGRQGVVWSEEFVAAVPLEAEVWVQTEGSSGLRKFGDLQEFKDCIITKDGVRKTPTHSVLCS